MAGKSGTIIAATNHGISRLKALDRLDQAQIPIATATLSVLRTSMNFAAASNYFE